MSEAVLSERRRPVEDAFVSTEGIASLTPDLGRLLVVVGVFDGLHRGHLYLLRQLRRAARGHRARPAVITFDAHPREIITGAAPPQLCDAEERLVRLAAAGVEVTVVQHFDRRLRETTYQDFVAMIRDRVDLAGFLMTPDAAFGHERRGTVEALTELGRELEFAVEVVPPLTLGDRPVRSSEIRQAVAAGDLPLARYLLGRSLSVVGEREDATTAQSARGRARPPETMAALTFPVPAALPPPGRYGVAIGRPWRPGEPELGATTRATATIPLHDAPLLVSSPLPLPAGSRLRVVFQRRLGSPHVPASAAAEGGSVARGEQA